MKLYDFWTSKGAHIVFISFNRWASTLMKPSGWKSQAIRQNTHPLTLTRREPGHEERIEIDLKKDKKASQ